MSKKITITTAIAYVLLAISIGLFFAAGLGVIVTSSLAVEYGLKLGSYSFAWHLMSLMSGNLFTTNKILACIGWGVIGLFIIACIGLLCAKKSFSRRVFEGEFVQLLVTTLVTLAFLFVFRYFNIIEKFNSYNGTIDGIWYILWIVFFALYFVAQVVNYFFVITRKVEVQEEIIEEVIEEPVEQVEEEKVEEKEEEKPVEEPKEEEKPVEEETEETEEEIEPEEEEKEEQVEETDEAVEATPKAKRVKVTFEERLAKADPTLVEKYHEIREEIMSYGIKSRVSSSGDTFRLHTVKYMKIVVAGKKLKLYMKLNPRDYDSTTIPHSDASSKALYAEIPMVFKVNSPLSVKRAKGLIADMMAKENIQKKAPKKAKED